MKKIMFMMNSLYGGGAEKVLQTILKNINYNKYDVTLYSMHRENIDYDYYPAQVHYKVIFDVKCSNTKIGKILYKFLSKVQGKIFSCCPSTLFYKLYIHEKYDVEIAFIEGESTKIVSGSPNLKSKKIAWVHVDLESNPWTEFLYDGVEDESKHYQKFDKILCVSDVVRKTFSHKYGLDSSIVQTQYNPIDREDIISKSTEACDLPTKRRMRIISVGRLVEQKGYDRLLRAAKRLKNEKTEFDLYILGKGEMEEELQNYIHQNGLEENVFLLGFKNNPYPYMAQSDLMVCSSRAEGFSTVISEGIALGLPIISTDCAGIRELFGDFECGVITENTEDALFEELYKVMKMPENLKKYRAESYKRGKEFSLNTTMKQLEDFFDE